MARRYDTVIPASLARVLVPFMATYTGTLRAARAHGLCQDEHCKQGNGQHFTNVLAYCPALGDRSYQLASPLFHPGALHLLLHPLPLWPRPRPLPRPPPFPRLAILFLTALHTLHVELTPRVLNLSSFSYAFSDNDLSQVAQV